MSIVQVPNTVPEEEQIQSDDSGQKFLLIRAATPPIPNRFRNFPSAPKERESYGESYGGNYF